MFKVLVLVVLGALSLNAMGMPEEYSKLRGKESKKYFFDYMYSLVEKENLEILQKREFVSNLLDSNLLAMNFNSPSFSELLKIKKKYNVKSLYSKEEYLRKLDVVPPSMALAQAAVESGWGKSRFINKANNIFGHWTYNPKIGMMPEQRAEGATHFIRIFETLQASIKAYMLNLSRNRAYKSFQNKRYEQRLEGLNPDGLALSQTMLNYSGIGEEYLKILKTIIDSNKLLEYDKKFYNKIGK
jgi:Bax protein